MMDDAGRRGDAAAIPVPAHEWIRPRDSRPGEWIVLLHGIYGRGRNWRSPARRLVEARPDLEAALVDLRGHGDSVDFPSPHTLDACARDLTELVAARGRPPAAVLGHSFGGKVALALVELIHGASDGEFERLGRGLRQIWVLDSTPSRRPPGGTAVRLLEAIRETPGPFHRRHEAMEALRARGFSRKIRRWMATNLVGTEEGWRWSLDPGVMESLLDDFRRTDLWSVVEEVPPGLELRFVRATRSRALSRDDRRRIEGLERGTDRVRLHQVEAGHWLHVDNPDALHRLLARELVRD